MNCTICCDNYNKSTRKEIQCNMCNETCCRSCVKKFILNELDIEPHCMFCRKPWSMDLFRDNMPMAFISKQWKHHIEEVLFQEEISKLPETQQKYERQLYRENLTTYKGCLYRMRHKLSLLLEDLNDIKNTNKFLNGCSFVTNVDEQITYNTQELQRVIEQIKRMDLEYNKMNLLEQRNEANNFVKNCPINDCRGFLSSRWKCGICQIQVCNKCGDILTEDEHECKDEDVKTMEFIKKDTKPCNQCGTRIHKIDGCTLMWCTNCHYTFDWKTGKKATGHNHNPHFYEWQRQQNNGEAPRVPGDNQCMEVQNYAYSIQDRTLSKILRFRGDLIYQLENHHDVDTEYLRIQYLTRQISETDFKKKIQQIHKKNLKNLKYREIVQTFIDASQDIFRRVITNYTPEHILIIQSELTQLKNYINNCIKNVRYLFNSKASGYIKDTWYNVNLFI